MSTKLFLLLLVMLAGALQAYLLVNKPVISRDAAKYAILADVEGHTEEFRIAYEHLSPPKLFYVTVLRKLGGGGRSMHLVGLLISFAAGMLTPIAAYYLAAAVVNDRRAAMAAALLCAVSPMFRELATEALRDAPFCLAFGVAVLCLFKGCDGRKNWIFPGLAGGSGALALALRYEGAELFLYAAGLLVYGMYVCESGRMVLLKKAGVFIVVFAICFTGFEAFAGLTPLDYVTITDVDGDAQ